MLELIQTLVVKRTRLVPVVVLLTIAVTALVWRLVSERPPADRVVLSGTIEVDEIHVGSRIGGRVARVFIQEGDDVAEGQPLVEFEAYDLHARRATAAALLARSEANLERTRNLTRPEELAEARAREEALRWILEMARNGPRAEDIEAARAELNAAEADVEVTRVTLERTNRLAETGVASPQDRDSAQSAYDRATGRRDAAAKRLEALQRGSRPEELGRAEREYAQAVARRRLLEQGSRREDVVAAESEVARARADLAAVETQIAELVVTSPANGRVEVLRLRPGDLVAPGGAIGTLVELDRVFARVFVPEPDLGSTQLGRPVQVTVDSYPGTAFNGRIEFVAVEGEFTPRNIQTRDERVHQVFAVRVGVEDPSHLLRAGMAAEVSIPRAAASQAS